MPTAAVRTVGRLIPAGTGFEYYRPCGSRRTSRGRRRLELERKMEYFVEPEEAFTRDEIE